MNVDVEIYMNNIVKFFRDNQKDLLNLVPKNKEQEFYNKIRETAIENAEKGTEISLTRKQLLDICVELNPKSTKQVDYHDERVFREGIYGMICLN